MPLIDITYDQSVGEDLLRQLRELLPDVVAEAVQCPEEPWTGPPSPGDIEIRFREKAPLDAGELSVVIEVRTKLFASVRVARRKRRVGALEAVCGRGAEVLRGLLLDSGDTLMRPRDGRWNPRFDFEEVLRRHVPTVGIDRLEAAFAAGDDFLRDWATVEARVGYKTARSDYHRAILAVLGVDDPTPELLEDLDRPLPFDEIVEPFADTADGLANLHEDGWRIAIVADTSPRMVDVYTGLGLDQLIETFVISGDLGCTKPDPRMYRTASGRLGLEPDECVFVDDNPDNVRAALALGYHACGMARYHQPPADGLPWVRNLGELRHHLRALRDEPSSPPTQRA